MQGPPGSPGPINMVKGGSFSLLVSSLTSNCLSFLPRCNLFCLPEENAVKNWPSSPGTWDLSKSRALSLGVEEAGLSSV